MAVDSSTHKVYVAGYNGASTFMGDSITVIDGTTNTVIPVTNSFNTGNIYPVNVNFEQYLAVDPATHKVFGYNGAGKVAVVDGAAYAAITTISLTGYGPSLGTGGLALDPASHNLWALGPAATSGSLLTVIDGTANTAGTQTPYTGTPTFLADDGASTGQVFVVTTNPQTVVLDGPITFTVPTGYTLQVIAENCGGRYSGVIADASGHEFVQSFDPTGMPTGQLDPLSSINDAVIAYDTYVTGGKTYLITMVEASVGGTTSIWLMLKRIRPC